jgi:segregation and condensation protein B
VDESPADAPAAAEARAEPLGAEAAAELARIVEALLFLSPEPVPIPTLAEACEVEPEHLAEALAALQERHAPGTGGLQVKEVAGGYTLATDPVAEPAARRLLARPRTPPLTPAQAETLAIVAYLQPVSRPEITRIRGVSADSAAATLLERGLVEESGRSQFGAVLYRTTPLFLKLFGLTSPKDLPDVSQWDPTPEEAADLRDRLLRAGEARTGGPGPGGGPQALPGVEGDAGVESDSGAERVDEMEPGPDPERAADAELAPAVRPMLAPAPAPRDGSPES